MMFHYNGGVKKIGTNIELNSRYATPEERKKDIKKISDIRNGKNTFKYYLTKSYIPEGSMDISDASKEKLFTDYRLLNKVIELFVSFCPDLTFSVPYEQKSKKKNFKKMDLIKTALNEINWSEMNHNIYDELESKGDVFFYIYFDEVARNDKFVIPKLKMLKSENMVNIVFDSANKPLAYIYKEDVYEEKIDYLQGTVTAENKKQAVFVFEKGKVSRAIQGENTDSGMMVQDKDGKMVIKTIKNKDSYKEFIPIIHIPSKKKQDERFSLIPASDYVDLCLQIAQIHSDIRQINRQMGYPRTVLLDCIFTEGDGRIGGVRVAKSINEDSDKQGQVIDLQLKNGQDSTFKELENAIDNLYDTVGVTNPTLMLKVGSSDSSKVYQQANNRMEQKISLYVTNIIEAFKIYFKILFLENDVYDAKHDIGYSFKKPESMIKTSEYDNLLNLQLKLNTGISTLQEVLRDKGKTSDEIKEHIKELNEELLNVKNDISINQKEVEKIEVKEE